MSTGVQPLEEIINEGFMDVFGNPIFLGLFLIGFFVALVFITRQRLDMALLILIPAFILGMAFIPSDLVILVAIGVAVIVYLAIMKFMNR
jgi:prepilin signal peptidase PulO-like enzyme (type II secretory pathway)